MGYNKNMPILFWRRFVHDFRVAPTRQLVVVLCIGFLFSFPVRAQESKDIPPGMELRRVNDVNLVLPKGVRVTERDGLIIIEPLETYVARRMQELEALVQELRQRLEKLESRPATGDAMPRAETL